MDFIYNESYFLTTFDLWLLVIKYNIPTIFISQNTILETNNTRNSFIGHNIEPGAANFIFILIPAIRAENIPNYKIILHGDEEKSPLFSLDEVKEECLKESLKSPITIDDFLTNFKKPSNSNYVKKKALTIIEEEEDFDEEVEREDAKQAVKAVKVKSKPKLIIEEDEEDFDEEQEFYASGLLKTKKRKTKRTKKRKTNKRKPKTSTKKNSITTQFNKLAKMTTHLLDNTLSNNINNVITNSPFSNMFASTKKHK